MNDSTFSAASAAVVEAFVAAYPGYVESRVTSAGDVGIAEGVRQGREWLEGELAQWARLGAKEQQRGPLQIFQTAMAFPTAALEESGAPSPDRDPGSASALPGDVYGLAPASSRDIGEAAWRAHVAWGVAKAKAVADVVPVGEARHSLAVAVVTMDQADRASIHLVAAGRGLPARHWRNPGAIDAGLREEIPRWAVVDSTHQAADDAVRLLADAGAKVVVYAAEPDDIATARWMSLGAATVVRRSQLVVVLESWLPLQA